MIFAAFAQIVDIHRLIKPLRVPISNSRHEDYNVSCLLHAVVLKLSSVEQSRISTISVNFGAVPMLV